MCYFPQASNLSHLFTLIRNDVEKSVAPNDDDDMPAGMPEGFAEDDAGTTPKYPKSLFLLLPLFDSYELNPVGYKAQERVSLPDGLDLDTPLVDPTLLKAELDGVDLDSEDQEEPDIDASENMAALQAAIKASDGSAKPKKAGKGPRVKADGTPESKEERAAVSGRPTVLAQNFDIVLIMINPRSVARRERRDRRGIRITLQPTMISTTLTASPSSSSRSTTMMTSRLGTLDQVVGCYQRRCPVGNHPDVPVHHLRTRWWLDRKSRSTVKERCPRVAVTLHQPKKRLGAKRRTAG
jgi:hypothetical protein